MKTFILILVLAISCFAQEYIGVADNAVYFINNVKRTGDSVRFDGLAAAYKKLEGDIIMDEDNYKITTFLADCKSFNYTMLSYYGRVNGDNVDGVYTKNAEVATKPQIIWYGLEKACKE